MAAHSSILAWRIPCTEEPGGLRSVRSQTVGHREVTDSWAGLSDSEAAAVKALPGPKQALSLVP